MALGKELLGLLLRQVVGETGDKLTGWLKAHFKDPTQALPQALERAHTHAWQCVELALAEPGLSADLRKLTASGALKALLQPVNGLLASWSTAQRQTALRELHIARNAGLLTLDLDFSALGNFAQLSDPNDLLQHAWTQLDAQAAQFTAYPQLNALLVYRTPEGPLLFLALGYFLRQEILKDEDLREELNSKQLRSLCQNQQAGFDALKDLLQQHAGALAQAFATLAAHIDQRFDQQAELLRDMDAKLQRLNAAQGVVEPRLTHVIQDPQERAQVREFLTRLRALPADQRNNPHLLNQLGKLLVATGELHDAEQQFQQAADAEGHYNRYRVLLEQRRWPDALAALLAAVQRDPARFEPFPLRKYRIEKILGAGGFGVAFLCQDIQLNQTVVIKILPQATLSRSVAEVFKEAQALEALNDPRIIRLKHTDYADAAQERPYLVMEYFAGQNLSDYLTQHGKLSPDAALTLAKELAQALQAAHSAGILHRDIKPDNLLVRKTEPGWAIKLIDFGLAAKAQTVRATVAANQAQLSLLGASLGGTYQYAAPEQLGMRSEPVKTYSDVYGFGKTLCQALFLTPNPTPRHWKQLGTHPLHDLLGDCIEDNPQQRPQDFPAVLQALGAAAAPVQPPAAPAPDSAELQRLRQQREATEARLRAVEAEEAKRQRHTEAEAEHQRQLEAERQRHADAERKLCELEAKREAEAKAKREAELLRHLLPPQDIHGWDTVQVQTLQRQVAEALGQPVEQKIKLKDGTMLELVLIPPGEFLMGSPDTEPERDGYYEQQHLVTIPKAFYVGKYAVTRGQFAAFIAATRHLMAGGIYVWNDGWVQDATKSWRDPGFTQDDWHPAVGVNWHDTQAYCAWLTKQTGQTCRLLTEAEWEYSCRAGTVTAYSFGDDANQLGNYAWYGDNGEGQTHPVGQKKPNPWGLYDMHGNVWEWTCSEYAAYGGGEEQRCGSSATARVLRGGSWACGTDLTRSAFRGLDPPNDRFNLNGFRLALGQ